MKWAVLNWYVLDSNRFLLKKSSSKIGSGFFDRITKDLIHLVWERFCVNNFLQEVGVGKEAPLC